MNERGAATRQPLAHAAPARGPRAGGRGVRWRRASFARPPAAVGRGGVLVVWGPAPPRDAACHTSPGRRPPPSALPTMQATMSTRRAGAVRSGSDGRAAAADLGEARRGARPARPGRSRSPSPSSRVPRLAPPPAARCVWGGMRSHAPQRARAGALISARRARPAQRPPAPAPAPATRIGPPGRPPGRPGVARGPPAPARRWQRPAPHRRPPPPPRPPAPASSSCAPRTAPSSSAWRPTRVRCEGRERGEGRAPDPTPRAAADLSPPTPPPPPRLRQVDLHAPHDRRLRRVRRAPRG